MNEEQIKLAMHFLEVRKEMLSEIGNVDEYSFDKIGVKVGVSGEAIRLLSRRDMSTAAQAARKEAQHSSASLLSDSQELIAAGWIICNDMLRLNTSVESFVDFLGISSMLAIAVISTNIFLQMNDFHFVRLLIGSGAFVQDRTYLIATSTMPRPVNSILSPTMRR